MPLATSQKGLVQAKFDEAMNVEDPTLKKKDPGYTSSTSPEDNRCHVLPIRGH